MRLLSEDEIIEQYIESGKIMYQTTLNGDYKKGNREGKKINKLFKYLAQNKELAYKILPQLLYVENLELQIEVATQCLILKVCEKEAEKVLINIANDEKSGIFAFNAEMTLKVWNEGNLKMH